jgi:hypothetical protein
MAITTMIPVTITVANQDELQEAAMAVNTVIKHVSPVNLIKLAAKIKANPSLVQTALKYI